MVLPRGLLYASCIFALITLTLWAVALARPWAHSIRTYHGDFHLEIWTDAGDVQVNETHHFEHWYNAYWKLLILSLSLSRPRVLPRLPAMVGNRRLIFRLCYRHFRGRRLQGR